MPLLPTRGDLEERVQAGRRKIRQRPPPTQIEATGSGEESVWRYPRPPRVERIFERVEVDLHGQAISRSKRAIRVLETSSPPVIYIPQVDLISVELHDRDEWALCEWKGVSVYFDLVAGSVLVPKAGWRYKAPFDDLGHPYSLLLGHAAIFPALFTCRLGDEIVRAQPGSYYGGWVTSQIKGPFKGAVGTEDW